MATKKDITVIGFGWSSIGFIQDIDTTKYNVTVISNSDSFVYTPLLAQNVKHNRNLSIHISSLNKDIVFDKGTVSDVDFENKIVVKENLEKSSFQYIIFAHGSDVNTFGIPGVKENTFYLKTSEDSRKIRDNIEKLDKGSTVAVIGCGLAGTELIGTLIDYNRYNVVAVDALERPLPTFNADISQRVITLWEQANAKLYFKSMVSKINSKSLDIKDKPSVEFDLAIWCGGIKVNGLTQLINQTLKLDCIRGIPVNDKLGVDGNCNVFAIGDCAFSGNPPTAQVAYQEGLYLAKQFNTGFQYNETFQFQDRGQIGYIGKGQSVYQSPTYQGGGKLIYYFNNIVHLYNFGKVYMKSKW